MSQKSDYRVYMTMLKYWRNKRVYWIQQSLPSTHNAGSTKKENSSNTEVRHESMKKIKSHNKKKAEDKSMMPKPWPLQDTILRLRIKPCASFRHSSLRFNERLWISFIIQRRKTIFCDLRQPLFTVNNKDCISGVTTKKHDILSILAWKL